MDHDLISEMNNALTAAMKERYGEYVFLAGRGVLDRIAPEGKNKPWNPGLVGHLLGCDLIFNPKHGNRFIVARR